MPELPEVETVRRGLIPVLVGRRITRAEVRRKDLRFPFPERFAERLCNRTVIRLDRRAKYLVARLDGPDAVIMHLGMSGRFTIAQRGDNAGRVLGDYVYEHGGSATHDHVVLHVDGGATVTYNDARRFGFMLMTPQLDLDAHPLLRNLGIEPLEAALDGAFLATAGHGKRCNLKALLLDQRIVAGLGNIYVCEALFRAGLAPGRSAATLATAAGRPRAGADRLAVAIREVLADALAAGGSTLRDYKQADGNAGAFQNSFAVYGRAGMACTKPGCRGIVRRNMQAGRSTFACPACQR